LSKYLQGKAKQYSIKNQNKDGIKEISCCTSAQERAANRKTLDWKKRGGNTEGAQKKILAQFNIFLISPITSKFFCM